MGLVGGAGYWVLPAGRKECRRGGDGTHVGSLARHSWVPQLFGSLVPGWLVGDLVYRFCTENMIYRQGKQ